LLCIYIFDGVPFCLTAPVWMILAFYLLAVFEPPNVKAVVAGDQILLLLKS